MGETAFVFHPVCIEHDPGPAHPERPSRLSVIRERIGESGLIDEIVMHEPREATEAELIAIHPAEHVEHVRQACADAPTRVDGDTTVSTPRSWPAAVRAAGGVLDAVERVAKRSWNNAFCAVRPPGHHAERARSMGFCLFNNIAIAARALRDVHGMERVAIVDWDVHHGNGTQEVFEEDPSVFFASLHQWPLYPGTGKSDERGRGAGEGTILNCPQAPGARDKEWLDAVDRHVLPALEAFEPQFILVSAGFDAHALDPLAQTELSSDAFAEMTRRMLELADRTAGGRLVSVLEGGYSLPVLAECSELHLGAMLEHGR